MNSDLSNIKVGDWIWTIHEGWTKVLEGDCGWETSKHSYYSNGKESRHDEYPSAFLEPPEGFNAGPKPCELKKGDEVLVGNSPVECIERRYFSHVDSEGNFHCFPFGETKWTMGEEDGRTIVWPYYKKWEEINHE